MSVDMNRDDDIFQEGSSQAVTIRRRGEEIEFSGTDPEIFEQLESFVVAARGVSDYKPRSRRADHVAARRAVYRALYRNGWGAKRIANACGRDQSTIYHALG